jgi:hypothetical protein
MCTIGQRGLDVVGDVEARHHEADRDGVALHYVTAGHGPPLVLLHGFLGTWWAWRRVIPWLAQDYRVIAVDMRGYGDSDKPVRADDPGFGYDSRNLAEDLHPGLVSCGRARSTRRAARRAGSRARPLACSSVTRCPAKPMPPGVRWCSRGHKPGYASFTEDTSRASSQVGAVRGA